MQSLGFPNLEFVPSVGRAGGILLSWKHGVDIQVITANTNLIHCIVQNQPMKTPWHLTLIYGPPTPVSRAIFWDSLHDIGRVSNGPWCILGDFNMVLNAADKLGRRPVASSSNNGLWNLIQQCGFIDLGFQGKAFTWTNKRVGLDNIQERLDRGFANDLRRLLFPDATITHLVALKSDHCPILLSTTPDTQALHRPF